MKYFLPEIWQDQYDLDSLLLRQHGQIFLNIKIQVFIYLSKYRFCNIGSCLKCIKRNVSSVSSVSIVSIVWNVSTLLTVTSASKVSTLSTQWSVPNVSRI